MISEFIQNNKTLLEIFIWIKKLEKIIDNLDKIFIKWLLGIVFYIIFKFIKRCQDRKIAAFHKLLKLV